MRKFLLFLIFCALPSFAFDVSVKASVDNAQVFVGDIFNYEIVVDAPENALVDLPSFVGNLGSFEVKDIKNERRTENMPKGRAQFVWQATLNTFVSGDFPIAPQEVQAVVDKDTVRTRTDPVAIKVSLRTTGEETDIEDAEDVVEDTRLPKWVFWALAILGGILLIVLGAFLHWKLRKKDGFVRLPPYEEAVLAMKDLQNQNLLVVGEQGDYFQALGFITRRYLERRFNVEILDATTAELKKRMAHAAWLQQAFKEGLVTMAEETEPVKFAKMKISPERCTYWTEWVNNLLEATKPVPEKEMEKAKKNRTKGQKNSVH